MIRRGQSRKAATRARKNSGSSPYTRAVLVLVAALTMALVVPFDSFGADESSSPTPQTAGQTATPTAPTAEQRAEARQWYRDAVKYRAKADAYYHCLGNTRHLPGTQGHLPYNGMVEYEKTRALVWKKRAEAGYRKCKAHNTAMRPCIQAGFPKWYCPILKKATARRGVAVWYRSPDLAFIIRHESGFNPRADNPTSTAYGLFQMLTEDSSDPYQQTLNGVRYIQGRYGHPSNAVAHWHANRWY